MELFAKISQAIPANKFQPPRFAAEQALQRDEILARHCNGTPRPRILYLEAQAGQGKTTLAIQYLERCGLPYCWYQAGIEDQDPILFISALLIDLTKAMPAFTSPLLVKKLADGEVSLLDLAGCVNILLHDLAAFLDNELIIVIDDLHLLEKSPVTVSLLDHLLATAPDQIRFLLASRRPLPLEALSLPTKPGVLCLKNEELALSRLESMELIHDVMQAPVSWPQIEKIHQHTSGWVMGLVLAGQSLLAGTGQLDTLSEGSIDDYFRREILEQLPKDLHTQLAQLSFLDEIEVPLAVQVTGMADIGARLSELMARNHFVRSLDQDGQVFGFHHFFQDFLQQLGKEILNPEIISEVLTCAAAHSLEKGRLEKALTYHLTAGQFQEIESLLRQQGMELLAKNRNITLNGILAAIPAAIIDQSAWLSLYVGLARLDLDPEATFPILAKARIMFVEQDDQIGELLAGAHILYSHFIFTSLYDEGARLLPRMAKLYNEVAEELPLYARIMVAKNIAMSATIMKGDIAMSRRFSDIALGLSQRHCIYNFTAATLLSRGYEYLLTSQFTAAIATAEQAYEFIHHEHVSVINRMALATYLLNLVDGLGDFHGYQQHKAVILQEAGADFVKRTLVGSSLVVWDIGIAVATGRLGEARELLHQAGQLGAAAHNPHMRSQFLHWQAYVAALEGNESTACKAADESMRLREISGSPFFVSLNQLILGASYALLARWQEAEALLDECIASSNQYNSLTQLAFAYLYRAFLKLRKEGVAACRDDLAQGLSLMRQNNFVHFLSWSPQIMQPLLQTAVCEGIESEYAEKLARERLGVKIMADGEILPLLTIQLLGGFALEFDGKIICHNEDLTPSQRQIFAMLLSRPDQCCSLDAIQLKIWPDSPPNKARSALDTQVSRLRKSLGDRCRPYSLKHYLVVGKGLVKLQNCRIDALEFTNLANNGLAHSRQEHWWQANNCFSAAMALWQPGGLKSDFFGIDEAHEFSLQLKGLLSETAITWSCHLQKTGRLSKALQVIGVAWRNNQASTDLVKTLFSLHLHNNDPAQARNVLREYGDLLRRDGYEDQEIEELCIDIREHA